MGVPTLGMREREPTKEFGDLAVLTLPGPNDEVPMVGHHRIAENPQWHAFIRLHQQLFEGREIALFLE